MQLQLSITDWISLKERFFSNYREKNSCNTGRMDILPDLYFFHVFLIQHQPEALLNTSNSCSHFWYSLLQVYCGWILWKAQKLADWSLNLQSTRIVLNWTICINELKWYYFKAENVEKDLNRYSFILCQSCKKVHESWQGMKDDAV